MKRPALAGPGVVNFATMSDVTELAPLPDWFVQFGYT
jgi:hypothetical protein